MPIVGDWDGDGDSDIGIFRPQYPDSGTNSFYLDINLTGGVAELGPYQFGIKSYLPVIGDWDGDGKEALGIYKLSTKGFLFDEVIYVDNDHSSPLHPNCADRTGNFNDPYCTIQEAIDVADTGEIVLVADGIYYENINFNGKAITVQSQQGPETTIIDGNQAGSVITFNSAEDANSLLDGFTVTNGYGTVKGATTYGGGIACNNSSPTIANCTIINNLAGRGGGIYCEYSSSPIINNCTIRNNLASYGAGIYCWYSGYSASSTITNCNINNNSAANGGGIACFASSPTIENCTINNNLATNGGGIYCWHNSSPAIANCVISYNSATYGGGIYCTENVSPSITNCAINGNSSIYEGGGFYCRNNSRPSINNCTINGNNAGDDGGGFYCFNAVWPSIISCIISNNASGGDGGGIACYSFASPSIINCIISSNNSEGNGGGFSFQSGSWPLITNCTISNNTASRGGGIYCYDFNTLPNVVNSILWSNTSAPSPEISLQGSSQIYIAYSNIKGGWGTQEEMDVSHNINTNPLFVGDGDYHLTTGSPCVDKGTGDSETYSTLPPDDIDGDARPQGAGYDMGADEVVYETAATPIGESVEISFTNSTITFENITTEGETTITALPLSVQDPPPSRDFQLLGNYYGITTTAIHSGTITVCFTYNDNGLTELQEQKLQLFHYNNDQWENITTSLETNSNTVCGQTDILSPFIIVLPVSYPVISLEMNLPAGWSMISLPVKPQNCTVSSVFPKAEVIYGYEKGVGYVRVPKNNDLEVGKGYWILVYEDQNSVLTGQSIPSYADTVSEDGWIIIGGCSSDAKISTSGCKIGVIYKYVLGSGYQRVLVSESLKAGLGYWILFKDIESQCQFMVEETGGYTAQIN